MDILTKSLITIREHEISILELVEKILFPVLIILIISYVSYFFARFFLKAILINLDTLRSKKNIKDNITSANYLEKHTMLLNKLKRFLKIGSIIAMLLVLISYVSSLFFQNILRFFTAPFYSLGTTKLSLLTTFFVLIFAYFSFVLSNIIKRLSKRFINKLPTNVAKRYSPFIQIFAYATLLLSFIVGLSLLGINLSSFQVVLGVIGVGLGFGLQDIVANFFSGLVITFSRIITEGDRVYIHEQEIEGDVLRINLINTVIRSLRQEELIIPNKKILNEPLQNYTHSDDFLIVGTSLGVDYDSDMHKVKEILIASARKLPQGVKNKDVYFRFSGFGDFSLNVAIYLWIYHVKDKYQAISDLNMIIWEDFKTQGIKVPFPQVEMKLKNPSQWNEKLTVSEITGEFPQKIIP